MKSLNHIVQTLYFEPMLITEKAHAALRSIVESKLAGFSIDFKLEDGKDLFGNPLPKMEMNNNTAIIPINGPIVKKASLLERTCGITGTTQIRQDIETALFAGVETIVFDINSPGGTVTGVPELADYIQQEVSQKVRTVSYIDELGASAAWWIGVASSEVYAAPTADILSVGVYNYFLDVSKAYEQMGIEVNLFKSGDLKAMGMPGVPLTDKQKAFLQADVDKIGVMFRSFVKGQRPSIPDEMLQGQTMFGYEVEAVGGIDGLANSISDVLSQQ